MIYALPVTDSIFGLSDIEVATLIVEADKTVGQPSGLLGADIELFVVFDIAGNNPFGEAIVDMMCLGAHATLVAFDEDSEDALPIVPLAYPSISIFGLVTSPSEEIAAS
jgi:hypothetical protein